MISVFRELKILKESNPAKYHCNTDDQVLSFERAGLYFVFNFNPVRSFEGYGLKAKRGKYTVVFDTDEHNFGGQNRIDHTLTYRTVPEKNYLPNHMLKLYLPARTAIVLKRERIKGIYDTH